MTKENISEREWVKTFTLDIEKSLRISNDALRVSDGHRLPYSSEILTYKDKEPFQREHTDYETDILVFEHLDEEVWKPRIVIETKLDTVTTHDAITYSQKALTHKFVHPYLRYGILMGNRQHHPLPGRLFRHGQHFDFMISWKDHKADEQEFKILLEILQDEIKASRTLEEIMYNSRLREREKFTSLHRPLRLE